MMKYGIGLVLLATIGGCSKADVSEPVGAVSSALNGELSPQGFLTIKSQGKLSTDEFEREQTTLSISSINSYYQLTSTQSNGSGLSISTALPTLAAFRSAYGFGGGLPEAQAFYYNRGDLGLGREMHCIDRFSVDLQIACYVTNFASGDAGEFTFGFSPTIAFDNMKVPAKAVATVAMVFRKNTGRENSVIFMVYSGAGNLLNNAPLDRHGNNYQLLFTLAAAFGYHAGIVLPPEFGTPGINHNNHIPSNCLNCHGGTYHPQGEDNFNVNTTDALFLPWDLDQLEFEDAPGLTRADQEAQLRALNQMARKVAFNSYLPAPDNHRAGLSSALVQQIDLWYNNTSHSQTLSGNFRSDPGLAEANGIPNEWNGSAEDRSLFYNVIRRCRGCHITSAIPSLQFNDPSSVTNNALGIANDIVSHKMPHALQAQREFWLSGQPLELEAYFRNHGQGSAADVLHGGGPDGIVLLDPPVLAAATVL